MNHDHKILLKEGNYQMGIKLKFLCAPLNKLTEAEKFIL